MNRTIFRFVIALLTLFVILAFTLSRRSMFAAQSSQPITLTRLFTGSDGFSHVEDVPLNFSPETGESDHIKASSAYVVRLPSGHFEDWHHAGRRRYVAPLSGHAEIEIANGEKVAIDPGHLYRAEDFTGKGHIFRVVGGADWVAVFVDLDQ